MRAVWIGCAGWVAAAAGGWAQATESVSPNTPLESILVTAKRADRISKGATGLDLDVLETPQSISTVTSEQMDRFGANDINDALRLVTGITVEEWETNRTNYMARGFEIKNTQIDGVGQPNDWGIITGAIDSFGFEKIEVIRGANGLLTGVGNSSGTVNFVRKRPTNLREGTLDLSYASYETKRLEADYSTPFTSSGSWAGRAVFATEGGESHLRGLSNERTFVYGVVDGQLGEHSTVTLGYSYQKAETDGNMWGALVLSYADGSQAEFDDSASTTQDWTQWNTVYQNAFAELTYQISEDWAARVNYEHRSFEDDSRLFFVYTFAGLNPDNTGLYGWPGNYETTLDADLVDVSVDGRFELFGREHEGMLGLAFSKGRQRLDNRGIDPADPIWGPLPAFPYGGDVTVEPEWGPKTFYSDLNQRITRGYGATRLSLSERWKAIVGFNWTEYHRDGDQTGALFSQTEQELSPYVGVTFEVLDNVLAYASYSDIYQPQDQTDIDEQYLDPSKGVNYEVGIKAAWLDNRLVTTLALFTAEQEGLSTFAGINDAGNYYYEGVDVKSEGLEAEVSGRFNDHVELVLGYTTLELEDPQGADIYLWVPRRTANLALSSTLPVFPALTLGVSGRWQSDISTIDSYSGGTVRQESYAVLSAFAEWDVTDSAYVRVNANNVTDEKHLTSLYQIGFYAAPANYSVSVGLRF